MAQRRAYHASSDPRFLDLGRYLAAVASVETAVKNDISLSRSSRRVALYIVECWRGADSRQLRYCHPPEEKIAADLDLSERVVRYAIAALKRAGYLRVHRGSKRRQQANRYFPRQQKAPAVAKPVTESEQQEIDEAKEETASRAEWARVRQAFEQRCEFAGMPCAKLPGWDHNIAHRALIDDIARRSKPITRSDVLAAWRQIVSDHEHYFRDATRDVLDQIELAEIL